MNNKARQMLEKKMKDYLDRGEFHNGDWEMGEVPIENALEFLNNKSAKIVIRPHKSK